MRYLIFICLICCGCKQAGQFFSGQDFASKNFEKVNPAYHWIKPNGAAGQIKCLEIVGDELVLIDSSNNILSFNSIDQTTKKISSGSANELIAPYNLFSSDRKHFTVYDLTSDSFLTYGLAAEGWQKGSMVPLPQELHGLPSISAINENSFLATSINNVEGRIIMAKVNPLPTVKSYIGKINKKTMENKYITGMVNRSACTYDPWTKQVYAAGFYTDQLECYNLNGGKVFSLKGPDNFEPEYKVKRVKGGDQVFVNLPQTRNAFFSLTTDKKYLYALYSGTAFSKPITNEDKTIYIFDKNGKPVKKIKCTTDIGQIRADENSHSLYCYLLSGPQSRILVYDTSKI